MTGRAGRIARWGLAGTALAAALAAGLYALYLGYEPGATRYPVRGIDVSHHQGPVDWAAVAAGPVDFVYLKATEGGDFRDPLFASHWDETTRVGLPRGAYHFFTLCRPGAEQAENFIATVPADPTALPPAVDLEFVGNCAARPAKDALAAELAEFLDRVEAHYNRPAVLYTTRGFYRAYLDETPLDRPYWLRSLWLAPRYGPGDWAFWQFHDRGDRPGISGPVDLNVFAGSADDFAAFRETRSP